MILHWRFRATCCALVVWGRRHLFNAIPPVANFPFKDEANAYEYRYSDRKCAWYWRHTSLAILTKVVDTLTAHLSILEEESQPPFSNDWSWRIPYHDFTSRSYRAFHLMLVLSIFRLYYGYRFEASQYLPIEYRRRQERIFPFYLLLVWAYILISAETESLLHHFWFRRPVPSI